MKQFSSIMSLILLICLFSSCASKPKYYKPLSELHNANILGTLEVRFETPHGETVPGNNQNNKRQMGLIASIVYLQVAAAKDAVYAIIDAVTQKVNEAAYMALLEAARRQYTGNIDVRDVSFTIIQHNSQMGLYEYNGFGTVVLLDE